MSYTVSKLLAIAIAEIGYKEKETNSQLDDKTANAGDGNYTKYARDLYAAGYYQANKNGYAWCDMFVDWCFLQLCGTKEKAEAMICQTGLYGAGCVWSAKYYKQQNRFYTSNPQPGDQIFFNSYAHTGIVEKIVGSVVHTIEGNTSNQVARRTYTLGSSSIDGYGRPKYDADTTTDTDTTTPNVSGATTAEIDVGSIVKITGTKYYGGQTIPAWVKAKNWVVHSLSGDRVVINKSEDGKSAIMSPVNIKDLAVVSKAPEEWVPAVGDKVKLASDATVYGKSTKFQSWVYNALLYIREIKGSRVVVSTQKTGDVTGAVDKKHLTKV